MSPKQECAGGKARARLAAALWLAAVPFAASAVDQSVDGLLEPSFTSTDATQSWLDRGFGKLRDGQDDGGRAAYGQLRLALDYQAQFTDTIAAAAALDGYAGNHSMAGVTEAWAGYAPVPESAFQYRLRAGMFLPPLSLENTATGWTTPYTLTPSLLNDWIGEELRAVGVEGTVKHLGVQSGSPNTLSLRLALFEYNDTSGTILAWRGWAANDRVTPWDHRLMLPDTAAFRPGGPYAGADGYSDPFIEVDHTPGYYLTGDWQYRDRLTLQLARYDNRADSTAFAHGQIGWRTRFDQLGVRWHAAEGTDVIAQYLRGDTLAGNKGSPYSVYDDFSSWFMLASREWDVHRVSLRYEKFSVTDNDTTWLDDNNENGHAWTAAYQYRLGQGMYAGVEYLVVASDHPERVLNGLTPDVSEKQYRLAFRYFF